MISTKPKRSAQMNLDTFGALLAFRNCERRAQFAALMFTTPEALEKRLQIPGLCADVATLQVESLFRVIEQWGWPHEPWKKPQSRPF